MNRTVLLGVLIYVLVFPAIVMLQGDLLLLALPLMLYLGVSLVTRPDKPDLAIVRKLSAVRTNQGEPVTVDLTITNHGEAIDSLHLQDQIPDGLEIVDESATTLTAMAPGQTIHLSFQIAGRRGVYLLPGVQATATDRFGLAKRSVFLKSDEETSRLFVLPDVQKLPRIGIRPPRTRVFAGTVPARKGGPGTEFFGVRPYQPGDSLHWINHRASARFDDEFFVNEFEQERAVDIGLILDVRRETNLFPGNRSLLEHSVMAAATLADAFLDSGNRVGLFAYGGGVDWTLPGYGKRQRERILHALARVRLEEHQVFKDIGHLPTRLFPIRSQLVLVSPLRTEDGDDLVALRARGYQLLTVIPDPVDFERLGLGASLQADLAVRVVQLQRNQLLQRLHQAGIQTFEWKVETPFAGAALGRLDRAPRWSRGVGGI